MLNTRLTETRAQHTDKIQNLRNVYEGELDGTDEYLQETLQTAGPHVKALLLAAALLVGALPPLGGSGSGRRRPFGARKRAVASRARSHRAGWRLPFRGQVGAHMQKQEQTLSGMKADIAEVEGRRESEQQRMYDANSRCAPAPSPHTTPSTAQLLALSVKRRSEASAS